MVTFAAFYYDGQTAAQRPVSVTLTDTELLEVRGDGLALDVPCADAAFEPPIGTRPRRVGLPGGASLEVFDHEGFDTALGAAGLGRAGRTDTLAHALERHWGAVLVGVFGLVAGIGLLLYVGLPWAAERAVPYVPPSVDAQLSAGAVEFLDEATEPTELPEKRQVELETMFDELAAQVPTGEHATPTLVLRKGGTTFGANALALPDGTVYLFDELVELAESDDELRAVLAHELGHVAHRHALRALLQDSAAAAVMLGVLGDVNAASSLLATLPSTLVQAGYSREFEREADAVAFRWMREHQVPESRLRDLLRRLEKQHGGDGEGGPTNWLSTHPATEERVPGKD